VTRSERLKLTFLSATAITSIGLAAPAMAQEQLASADTTASDEGNEIIVTATRRAVTLQDVPINISAISPDEIQKQRLDDMQDLQSFTPGITITETGPRSAGAIVMRGLSASDSSTFGANGDNAVGSYLGEIPLYLDFKLIDLQRVEVLLGPQGTLYGLGTLAGAIRYIPERPDATKWGGYVHGRVYDVNHGKGIGKTVDAAINIPIVKDILAFRSATGYYYDPGFIDYPYLVRDIGVSDPQPGPSTNPLGTAAEQDANFDGKSDVNFEKTLTSRNQVALYADWFKAYVTYVYQRTRTDGRQANGGGVLGEGKYEGPWRVLEPSDRKSHLVSLETEIELGDFAQIVSATAYTEKKSNSSADVTDLLLDLDYGYEAFPAFTGYTRQKSRTRQFNQELRLVSTHGGPFSWVIGGFYNRQKVDSTYREVTPGIPEFYGIFRPDNFEYASYVDTKTVEKAVFGEGTFRITPEWQVTAGLRYFKYNADVDGGSGLPLFAEYPDLGIRSRQGSTKDDGTVWKFNTSYNFTPDLMVYATYSKGYRIGGVNRVAPCVLPLDPDKQNLCALENELFFGPDKVKNKEIGVRGQFFDRRLTTNLSLFHVKWDGIQLAGQTVNGAIGITTNGGAAVSKGVDFSFSAKVTPQLTIQGNYSYLDAKLTEDVPALLSIHGGDLVGVFDGDRLPGSTKNSGALGVTYEIPMADDAGLTLNWTSTYTGGIYSRPGLRGGGERLPAYTLHRASIMYGKDNWEFGVYANNIFDKYAITGIDNDLTRRNIVNDDIVSRYYARSVVTPRVVGVEGRFKF
jgi:iron complex outermembrane receptor protein